MFWRKCTCTSKLTEEERIKAWMDGFNIGMSKSIDQLVPLISGNIETIRKKIYEDAISESLKRMGRNG